MSKSIEIDVITTIRQTIEVPEDYDKQDILNFLASQQSFNDAFRGLENDAYPGVSITEIEVIDEEFDDA
jgi:HrpA-like RNA helicase